MQLTEATWTDADAVETDLAVLPVGSTEQHGPHAPLGTDRLTARAVAAAGAERYEDVHDSEVVVAPTIPVGIAEEHRQFAGTLWVAPDTLREYVREVVASLASHGWDRVVLVNGHGGNVDALREVCGTITRHDAAYAVPFTWFEAAASLSEMGHGGPIETALLRAIHPDLVREDRIEAARAGASETWGEWVSGTNLAFDAAEFTDSGAVGDPSDGSAERGEELLEAATAALVALLDAIEDRDVSRPKRK
ncbi:creatininase family protein [Halococcus agarilyticus]|uniref:creatininase family protein n=1 Tax=Halococcus agarilyticus TaxID=1232219 RepID=UPI000677BBFC|nr:creatininase family protein [Halococcus agarilyticus]